MDTRVVATQTGGFSSSTRIPRTGLQNREESRKMKSLTKDLRTGSIAEKLGTRTCGPSIAKKKMEDGAASREKNGRNRSS